MFLVLGKLAIMVWKTRFYHTVWGFCLDIFLLVCLCGSHTSIQYINMTVMWIFNVSTRKNPNQVDIRTVRVLMEVAELHRKHLGGQLLFSPNGLLHIILGDGMITLDDMEEMDGLR